MSLRLAPVHAAAAEPLSLMHAACFPDDPWDAASFEDVLALHGVFGYVAWLDDEPAGFILARDLGGEAEILTLGVLPGVRRLGIGRALLDEILAQSGRRHLGSIVLEVASDNEGARRLYGATGFSRVGARPRYYRRGQEIVDALLLRLRIEAETDRAQPDGAPR